MERRIQWRRIQWRDAYRREAGVACTGNKTRTLATQINVLVCTALLVCISLLVCMSLQEDVQNERDAQYCVQQKYREIQSTKGAHACVCSTIDSIPATAMRASYRTLEVTLLSWGKTKWKDEVLLGISKAEVTTLNI